MENLKYILSSIILTLFLFGCDVQEPSQDVQAVGSTENYSIASFSVTSEGSSNEGDETVYTYTVTLDKPMTKKVNLYFKTLDGTSATEHVDFDYVNSSIAAYTTTTTMQILVYNDDLIEGSETINATIAPGPDLETTYILNPVTVYPEISITIDNFTSGDLDVTMDWTAENGSGDSPYALADLILLITDAVNPYTDVIGSSDGGSAEHVTISSDTPDGDYFVVADVFALDDSDFDIDITVTFDQGGVVKGAVIDLPAALNSRIICSNYVVLAKITKVGNTYTWSSENATVTSDGTPDKSSAAPFIGTASVVSDADWADYSGGENVAIEAGTAPNKFVIRNYDNPSVVNPDIASIVVTIDPCGTATVTPGGVYNYTNYGCSADGTVSGTGSVDPDTGLIDLFLDYDIGCGVFTGMHLVLQAP